MVSVGGATLISHGWQVRQVGSVHTIGRGSLQSKRIEGRFNGQMKYASVEGNDIKLSLPSIVS